LRATRLAAAAPNSRIIGGAGTGTPPVEVDVETLPELDADVAELVLDAELALVLDEVEVLVAPKLLDEIVPLDVEVELPPVEVELPPVEVEPPEVEVEPPEVEVEPPEVETVIVVLPPVELPPTKLPLKKPAPKPLPKPAPEPAPMTIGTPPLALLAIATGGGGGGGTNIGGMMVRVVVTCGIGQETARTVRCTSRRRYLLVARRTWPVRAWACAWLTRLGRGGGFSATWTAPPPMMAPPQVQAQSFAKAILTDITSILFLAGMEKGANQYPFAGMAIRTDANHRLWLQAR
jgi:hypothetical protein